MTDSPLSYPLFCAVAALLCLSQGLFIYIKNPKDITNKLFSTFCVCIGFWLLPLAFLSSKQYSQETNLFLSRIIYTGVVFLPTLMLHISVRYLKNNVPKNTALHLRIAYVLTGIFLVLVWASEDFICGVYYYSWGYFPKGGSIHKAHVIFVIFTATFSVYLLFQGMWRERIQYGKTQKYYQTKYMFLAFLFVLFAAVDFLPNMGVDIYPPGFLFILIFVYATTYALFKHNLMGISVVIKKSLVYSALVTIIATLYFIVIYLASTLLKDLARIQSLPMTVGLLTLVTLISRPLERKITAYVDGLFFKKPLHIMERENQLLHSEMQKQDKLKAISTLAAGMAHEIKNPLTSLKTFAQYLPTKYDDPQFREKFSRIVSDEVDRVNNIVKQMLEFSKPEQPKLQAVNVNELLESTLELLSSNLLNNKMQVHKNLHSSPNIKADKNQIKQVFLNIILNAIQAMPGGGMLTVSTQTPSCQQSLSWHHTKNSRDDSSLRWNDTEKNLVIIRISDTGSGIPQEKLDKIFDPFFTTKEDGTGLGLSVVYGIIKEHGADIQVQSKLGQGTTFTLNFKALA